MRAWRSRRSRASPTARGRALLPACASQRGSRRGSRSRAASAWSAWARCSQSPKKRPASGSFPASMRIWARCIMPRTGGRAPAGRKFPLPACTSLRPCRWCPARTGRAAETDSQRIASASRRGSEGAFRRSVPGRVRPRGRCSGSRCRVSRRAKRWTPLRRCRCICATRSRSRRVNANERGAATCNEIRADDRGRSSRGARDRGGHLRFSLDAREFPRLASRRLQLLGVPRRRRSDRLRGARARGGRGASSEPERCRPRAEPRPWAQPPQQRGRRRARAPRKNPVSRSAPFERGGPASLHRIRLQAGRRAARLLSGAARSRGRAGPRPEPVNARRERYLEEMGLGPVWKLRSRIRESTEPSERPPETSVRVKPAHSAAGPEATGDSGDRVRIEPSWKARLLPEFSQPYMRDLREFLKEEISARKVIYPRGSEYFAALDHTPFDKVKVVILGQDPYHGPNQAHGLCFSVRPGVDVPPSLQNIFIELKDDLGIEPPNHG